MRFEQFYEFQNMTYPWTFQDNERTIRHFWMGFFATCLEFLWSNMTRPGSLELDPGSQGKPSNLWCISFETECTQPLTLSNCTHLVTVLWYLEWNFFKCILQNGIECLRLVIQWSVSQLVSTPTSSSQWIVKVWTPDQSRSWAEHTSFRPKS